MTTGERILLYTEGRGACPPLEDLHCRRAHWKEFDLGFGIGEIFRILKRDRRSCRGFYRHIGGLSPDQHLDLILKAKERWSNFWVVMLAGAIGGFVARLPDIVQWILEKL